MKLKDLSYARIIAIVASTCVLVTACSQPESRSTTTTIAIAKTTTTAPLPLSDFYPNFDWRYIDYVFYFVGESKGDSSVERLIKSVQNTLRSKQSHCLVSKQVESFDLSQIAKVLDQVLKTWISNQQWELLRDNLVAGLPLELENKAGAYVFPNVKSPVNELLKWWLSSCGDNMRGRDNTKVTTSTQPAETQNAGPKTCRDEWMRVGEQYLSSKCTVVSRSNCRVTFQQKEFDPVALTEKTLSRYLQDVTLKDGTQVVDVGATYGIPCG